MYGSTATRDAEQLAIAAIGDVIERRGAIPAADRTIVIHLRRRATCVTLTRTDIAASQAMQYTMPNLVAHPSALDRHFAGLRGYVVRIGGHHGSGLAAVTLTISDARAVVRRLVAEDEAKYVRALAEDAENGGKTLYRAYSGGEWGPAVATESLAWRLAPEPANPDQAVHLYCYHHGWLTWLSAFAPRGCAATVNQRASRPTRFRPGYMTRRQMTINRKD